MFTRLRIRLVYTKIESAAVTELKNDFRAWHTHAALYIKGDLDAQFCIKTFGSIVWHRKTTTENNAKLDPCLSRTGHTGSLLLWSAPSHHSGFERICGNWRLHGMLPQVKLFFTA